jgi:hypothetical protein
MFGEMKSGRNEQNYGDGPRSPHDAALSPPDLVIMAREVSFDSVIPHVSASTCDEEPWLMNTRSPMLEAAA